MQRILITVQHLELGGMEKLVAELALGLRARGYEICVVGVYGSGPHAQRLRDAGVKVYVGLACNCYDLRAVYRMWRICRIERIDFAIAAMGSDMYAPLVTSLSCRWLGIPCVRWVHSTAGSRSLSRIQGFIQRQMTKADHQVVALTHTHARSITEHWGVPASQITVIWNGQPLPPRTTPARAAEVRKELGLRPEDFVVGMVANFRPIKRHELLVRAMRHVVDRVPHARVLFVGDGQTRPEVANLAADLNLQSHVVSTGAREDAVRLYAAMDVHVLCTYPTETFPLAVTEAMAAGVVPIATRVGGVPELVADDETGLLVQPECPEALAEAIIALAEDTPRRKRLSEAAHRFATTHFSLDAMVDGFVRLMEASLATTCGPE